MTTLSLEAVSTVRSNAYRKTAWRLMPFLMLCYLCAYLDRVNVGFAKLQMMNDLALSETVYGLGAGMFFIGYFLCEVPSNIILHKVGARVWTKAGNWTKTIEASHFGCDVHGKTLGIIGLGKIGEAIARRGRFGFGMNILYSGNNRKPELERELGARFVPQEKLLSEFHFVCPVVPLTDGTRNLIGRKELALMGPESILINVSRGPVVDQDALLQALEEKTIRAAGLDVYVKEPLMSSGLFKLKSVVTVPHIGSATSDTRNAMALRALENLLTGLEGRQPRDLVNTHELRDRWTQ